MFNTLLLKTEFIRVQEFWFYYVFNHGELGFEVGLRKTMGRFNQ